MTFALVPKGRRVPGSLQRREVNSWERGWEVPVGILGISFSRWYFLRRAWGSSACTGVSLYNPCCYATKHSQRKGLSQRDIGIEWYPRSTGRPCCHSDDPGESQEPRASNMYIHVHMSCDTPTHHVEGGATQRSSHVSPGKVAGKSKVSCASYVIYNYSNNLKNLIFY